MKRLLILALLLAAPFAARAQQASEAETRLLREIAQCLAAGLPQDWQQAEMVVELKQPGAETGEARYLMRRKLSGGEFETFKPCDARKAPRMLVVEMRKLQPRERRGWKGARFVIHRDGKFDLTFDYPK
jgi:hypothetical protein